MNQLRLRNNTGKPSIIGKLIKIDPNDPKGFVYAPEGDPGIIGKVTRRVLNNSSCLVTKVKKSTVVVVGKEVVINASPPDHPAVGEILVEII
jgi:hypothetical protein